MSRLQRFQNRQIRQIIYRFKRTFGTTIDYLRGIPGTPNLTTGVTEQTITQKRVARAVVLDVTTMHKFEYDLGFIAANKNFTYGGQFEQNDVLIIVDALDIFGTPNIDTDYAILGNGRRVTLLKVTELQAKAGYVFHARQIQTGAKKLVVTENVVQSIYLTEELEVE